MGRSLPLDLTSLSSRAGTDACAVPAHCKSSGGSSGTQEWCLSSSQQKVWVEAEQLGGQLALLQEVTATPRVEVMWKARQNFASLIVLRQLDACLSVTTIASAGKLLLCAKRDRNVDISARGWRLVLAHRVIYKCPWLRCSLALCPHTHGC